MSHSQEDYEVDVAAARTRIMTSIARAMYFGMTDKEAHAFIQLVSSNLSLGQLRMFESLIETIIPLFAENQKLKCQLKEQSSTEKSNSVRPSSFADATKGSLLSQPKKPSSLLQPKKSPSTQQMPDSSKLVTSGSWTSAAEEAKEADKSDAGATSDVDVDEFETVIAKKEYTFSNTEVRKQVFEWMSAMCCITFSRNDKTLCKTCKHRHLSADGTVSAIDTTFPMFTKFGGYPLYVRKEVQQMVLHFVCGQFYNFKSIMCGNCGEHPALTLQPENTNYIIIFSHCRGCCGKGDEIEPLLGIVRSTAEQFKKSGSVPEEVTVGQIFNVLMGMLPQIPKWV